MRKKLLTLSKNHQGSMALVMMALLGLTALPAVAAPETTPLQAVLTQSQTAVVKGTVVDDVGDPVIGATVMVVGANGGTITNVDGQFSLNCQPGATLRISYVGFKTATVEATRQPMHVVLATEDKHLEEVVVVGYGSMRKKDLTGSVVQINAAKLEDTNPMTVSDMLRGVPGLQVGFNSSAKGGASIELRGRNSLYNEGNHNSPLIILDGMQFNGELSEINPDDIGQIDVLKDASSAAIYGAKAASGVIIIVTKKGKQGKPVINVSANVAANTKAQYRKMFGANDYMTYREDWYKATTYGADSNGNWGYYNDGHTPNGYYDRWDRLPQGVSVEQWANTGDKQLQTGESYKSLYARRMGFDTDAALVMDNYMNDRTYDWEKATFRTGFNQDYNASISGATDVFNYYASFGVLKNEGAIQGDDYRAYRSNIKLNAKVNEWLELGVNVNFQDRSDESNPVPMLTNYWDDNQLRESPYASRYDEFGKEQQYPRTGNPTNPGYNYHFENQYTKLEKGYTVLNTIFNAKVTLPFGFTYSFNIAPRLQWHYDRYFTSAELPNSTPSSRGVNRKSAKTYDWTLNNTLTWDRTFDKHHFIVTLVQEAEENRYWNDNIEARNITPTDVLGLHYISGANKEQSSFWSYDTHSTASAYLGRLFYAYNDRYMFTGTVRRDGYSAFGQNQPWATFWSVGGSWIFSEESFVQLPWLDMGKLRVSYGTNGNRSLADTYLALSNLSNGGVMGYYENGSPTTLNALYVSRLGNPNLEWEKTSAVNVGLDFSVLNKRITGSIEWYSKRTHDMIMSQRLPNFTGFDNIATNLGEVTNSGVELTINSMNIVKKNFTWETSFGFSYNKNRIKHLYYEYDEDGKEIDDRTNSWFINKPIGEIWDYEVIGIWQKDEAAEAAKVGQKPGDPKVANHYTADDKADGTPVYNDNDKIYHGTTIAPIYWSLRNEFTFFKDFTFSFSMYSYMGHKSRAGYYLNNDNSGSMFTQTCNTYDKEYWTPDNPTNDYGRLNAVGPNGATGVNKVYNRSFVRLDNITLGYNLPQKWISKFGISRARVTANIHNVCTISGWEYGDPETGNFSNRQFQFGVNLTL